MKLMKNRTIHIDFKHIQSSNFRKIYDWILQPHVNLWWSDSKDWSEFRLKFQQKLESPYRACFITYVDGIAIGYIQSYVANKFVEWSCGPDNIYGMDLFIGDINYIGRGLGSKIIMHFVQKIFELPVVERIIVDPNVDNVAAIKAYGRAGFKKTKEIKRLSETVILMEIERPVR